MFSIVVGTVMLTAANGKLERNHRTRQYALSFITCSDTCTRFDESGRKDVDSRGCSAGRIGPRNLGNPSISTEFPTSCTAVSDLTSARFIVPRCLCVNTAREIRVEITHIASRFNLAASITKARFYSSN